MSTAENPAVTLERLLRQSLHVLKEDGSLADVVVSQQWLDRELVRNCYGQVTVGFESAEDKKLSFDGKLRRTSGMVRVNVWVPDKPEQGIACRRMRDRITAEVARVIKENRDRPNRAEYTLIGAGRETNTHKVFYAAAGSEPSPADPSWAELDDDEYRRLWYSDDDRVLVETGDSGKRAFLLFRFKTDAQSGVLQDLTCKFEGHGRAQSGDGVTVKVWNSSVHAWERAVSGVNQQDEVLTLNVNSNPQDYMDTEGRVHVLAETTGQSDGTTKASIHCDCAEIEFTVKGATYADVIGVREMDEVHVKPFIWRTEVAVKTWAFETIP